MPRSQLMVFVVLSGVTTSLLLAPDAEAEIVFNPDTNSYYELVEEGADFDMAVEAASLRVHAGRSGRLVTIESSEENLFLTTTFGADELHVHWIGGFQQDGSQEPDGGWMWVTGDLIDYNNWAPGEPNDYNGIENAIMFDHGVGPDGKYWNDVDRTNDAPGYLVEYPESEVAAQASAWGAVKALFD
jgi:hypothetical protein